MDTKTIDWTQLMHDTEIEVLYFNKTHITIFNGNTIRIKDSKLQLHIYEGKEEPKFNGSMSIGVGERYIQFHANKYGIIVEAHPFQNAEETCDNSPMTEDEILNLVKMVRFVVKRYFPYDQSVFPMEYDKNALEEEGYDTKQLIGKNFNKVGQPYGFDITPTYVEFNDDELDLSAYMEWETIAKTIQGDMANFILKYHLDVHDDPNKITVLSQPLLGDARIVYYKHQNVNVFEISSKRLIKFNFDMKSGVVSEAEPYNEREFDASPLTDEEKRQIALVALYFSVILKG